LVEPALRFALNARPTASQRFATAGLHQKMESKGLGKIQSPVIKERFTGSPRESDRPPVITGFFEEKLSGYRTAPAGRIAGRQCWQGV